MKFFKAFIVLVVLGSFFTASSCKQKTCPAYSKVSSNSDQSKA